MELSSTVLFFLVTDTVPNYVTKTFGLDAPAKWAKVLREGDTMTGYKNVTQIVILYAPTDYHYETVQHIKTQCAMYYEGVPICTIPVNS